jgi:hypothetical protein
MKKAKTFFLFLFAYQILFSQTNDTVKYQWPVTPFNSSQALAATFCEFRNTLSSDHFHNAVDIPKADGSPVYPCLDGIVYYIDNASGSNSYVRIRSLIDGKWKHLTYLHMIPTPGLIVGQEVKKGETIIGTVYPGQGHNHLIERQLVTSPSGSGTAMNNIRINGGLQPYTDSYFPKIYESTVGFFVEGTKYSLPANGLAGKIDIKIKIEDPNGISTSYGNNAPYIVGYKIWNADKSEIIYSQFPDGIVYRFDLKPIDDDVHNTYVQGEATLSNPVYWLTNGNGADYINQNLRVNNNSLNTELIPEGEYQLEVFAEDALGNHSEKFIPITITRNDVAPPSAPTLLAIINFDNQKSLKVIWKNNTDPDIKGYRLYYSVNTQLSSWALAGDESMLTKDIDNFSFNSPIEFITPTNKNIYFFYLTAVDSAGNESERSDIYSRSSKINNGFRKGLIVDGFDRFGGSGSYQYSTHSFNTSYFISITMIDSIVLSSCANESITLNKVDLNDFDFVVWFLGDESTTENTFDSNEQSKIADYLKNGGKLIVSGSEVGWDLDRTHSYSQPADTLFYRHYLKARLVDDGNSSMNTVQSSDHTYFQNLSMTIGQVYPEDYPDDINPTNGGEVILNYNQQRTNGEKRNAGIAYKGKFGDSQTEGGMIYISFPLETVNNLSQRNLFMQKVFQYFDIASDVNESISKNIPNEFDILQNFPNPFNPSTKINFISAKTSHIKLEIFDLLGQNVAVLTDNFYQPGNHEIIWDASGLSSGIYFVRMLSFDQSGSLIFSKTIQLILLK